MLLFSGARWAPSESVYRRVWQLVRGEALTPAQVASALARRPYDLHHSGVTLALNAGVSTPKVARRLGTALTYCFGSTPGCFDVRKQMWNDRSDALKDGE